MQLLDSSYRTSCTENISLDYCHTKYETCPTTQNAIGWGQMLPQGWGQTPRGRQALPMIGSDAPMGASSPFWVAPSIV